MNNREAKEEKDMFTPEIMIKLNWRDDESNWGTLLLSLAFLASLVFLSLLSAFCLLPRADPISHTHTDTLLVTHTHSRRSATVPMPKHHPHGHILSPSSSSPVLVLSPSLPLVLSKYHMHTHMVTHSHKHSPTHRRTHWLLCMHRRRDGKGQFCRMLERKEGGWRERAREEGGKIEGGEKA